MQFLLKYQKKKTKSEGTIFLITLTKAKITKKLKIDKDEYVEGDLEGGGPKTKNLMKDLCILFGKCDYVYIGESI